MPGNLSDDSERLKSALTELVGGPENYKKIVAWLGVVIGDGPANPMVTFPWDGMPYPVGLSLAAMISTDQANLRYDVLLYKLPDTTHEIDGHYNVAGAPLFTVKFPAYHFVNGESYRVFVQVNPNPGSHNTHYADFTIFDWIPTYGHDDDEAAAKKGDGKHVKAAGKSHARNGEKALTRAGTKPAK